MSNEQFPDVVMPTCPAEQILKGQKALVTGGMTLYPDFEAGG